MDPQPQKRTKSTEPIPEVLQRSEDQHHRKCLKAKQRRGPDQQGDLPSSHRNCRVVGIFQEGTTVELRSVHVGDHRVQHSLGKYPTFLDFSFISLTSTHHHPQYDNLRLLELALFTVIDKTTVFIQGSYECHLVQNQT